MNILDKIFHGHKSSDAEAPAVSEEVSPSPIQQPELSSVETVSANSETVEAINHDTAIKVGTQVLESTDSEATSVTEPVEVATPLVEATPVIVPSQGFTAPVEVNPLSTNPTIEQPTIGAGNEPTPINPVESINAQGPLESQQPIELKVVDNTVELTPIEVTENKSENQ